MLQHIFTIFVLLWTKHFTFRPKVLQHRYKGAVFYFPCHNISCTTVQCQAFSELLFVFSRGIFYHFNKVFLRQYTVIYCIVLCMGSSGIYSRKQCIAYSIHIPHMVFLGIFYEFYHSTQCINQSNLYFSCLCLPLFFIPRHFRDIFFLMQSFKRLSTSILPPILS